MALRAGLLGLCLLAFVPAWAQLPSTSSIAPTAVPVPAVFAEVPADKDAAGQASVAVPVPGR